MLPVCAAVLPGLSGVIAIGAGCDAGGVHDGGEVAQPGDAFAPIAGIIAARCAFDRCHGAGAAGGGIDFLSGVDAYDQLVGIPSCQYPPFFRVRAGEPDQSWLMTKLTADVRPPEDPYATYIYFTPAAGFDPGARGCPDATDEGVPLFGTRMPGTAPNMLPPEELALIRRWIADGARR